MTTASKVTLVRIFLIPLFMAAALLTFPGSEIVALALFIIAGATDWVDGYIARKYDQISDFGKFMDPLADKLLVTAALLLFVQWGRMPAWVLMVVLTREFAVSGLRMMAAVKGKVIAAGASGKLKTVVTFVGICLMLLPLPCRPMTACGIGTGVFDRIFTPDNVVMAAILLTTVYSGIEYFAKNYKVLGER